MLDLVVASDELLIDLRPNQTRRLSQNFSQLLDDADDYDVIIRVGENQEIKEFYDILDLIIASDELLLNELVTSVQEYLIKNQTGWLQQNIVKVLHMAFQLESCQQLQNYCLESICDHPEPLFNSPDFPTLKQSILLGIVKRENLKIEEVELWNYLIEWGIAQASELKEKDLNNLSSWSENDFLTLSRNLNHFIAYIRFFDIASKDFHSNVRAFRKLLPQTLFEDIVSFHMSNTEPKLNKLDPRSKKVPIDSMIIKPKHAATLINWIQRKDANARIPINNKYKFNLIYRGSMDGFGTNDIRSKCDGHEACILVIKVKENDTIIGGYNPIGWNYNSNTFFVKGRKTSRKGHRLDRAFSINSIIEDYWVNTTESFIYSLGDGNDLNNFKISRVINNNYAIYESYHQHIPINFGYSDLVINGNVAGTCKKAYYESCILDTCHFTIEEMEVFVFQDGDDE
ncbi:9261_t:CDS:2 [Funneliformis geosporum]|uniref:9261_t:CDS:1 n=1 Tax=Funneliformis geosporum TaxID=1117311 RepID=A0A9W4WXW4_9GLOM|nr:9261_t:CDS:2 [Funneliformis geosporum]